MKKRVISLLLALVLAVSLLPTAAFAAETEPQGKGTAEEPYLIGTAGRARVVPQFGQWTHRHG